MHRFSNHTLFVENKKEQQILLSEEKSIYQILPKYKKYRVYIEDFEGQKKGLHFIFNELRKAKSNDELELRISSVGGSILEGQQFFNMILEKFAGGTTTYLDNHGYSMGALLFCMGDARIIYPYSDIMFHDYSHGTQGKGGEIKNYVQHSSKIMEVFFRDLLVKQGFFSEAELERMLSGYDFWMDAKEMCERGIATHVVVGDEHISAKAFLKELKKQKREEKKQKKANAKKK
jgi:ATP-dependent protease ClpP protease subunit